MYKHGFCGRRVMNGGGWHNPSETSRPFLVLKQRDGVVNSPTPNDREALDTFLVLVLCPALTLTVRTKYHILSFALSHNDGSAKHTPFHPVSTSL